MAIGGIAGTGVALPSVSGAAVLDYVLLFFGIILFAVIVLSMVVAIYVFKKYSIKIVLWKTVRGQTIPTGKFCASQTRIGMTGDYWTLVKGAGIGRLLRVQKVLPKIKYWAGKGEAWFFEREDGEWYNMPPPNLDEEMKQLKFKFSDEDMRLMRVAIARNLKDEFTQQKWWDKYGAVVTRAIEMVLLLVMIIFVMREIGKLIDKLGIIAGALAGVVNTHCSGFVPAASTALVGLIPAKWLRRER